VRHLLFYQANAERIMFFTKTAADEENCRGILLPVFSTPYGGKSLL
jgi:hypothetical protein